MEIDFLIVSKMNFFLIISFSNEVIIVKNVFLRIQHCYL